ncbi:MAG: NnrS family protein, partial [Sulfurovaceae bacterium]|nr:NnrS family protein [Sulfurovaceae bacterium]
IISIFIFSLLLKGTILSEVSSANYHAYSLIFLMFTPAFFAFLFTTFPRFSGNPPIEKIVYLTILVPFSIGSFFFLFGTLTFSIIASIGMIITLIGHLLGINILRKLYKSTIMKDKHDIFWILLSMSAGGVAHLLFIIGYFSNSIWLILFAIQIAIYLYIFLVAFSVAQRMVPFFSHRMIDRDDLFLRNVSLLLVGHIVLEMIKPHLSFISDFALMYIIANETLEWKLPFPNSNPLLWILHLSIFWVPVAFLFSGLTSVVSIFSNINFMFLDIHLLVLGFAFTILIGFGTRVTLGHSGNQLKVDRLTTILFYWTQVVVISRMITSLIFSFGWNFLFWFDITVTAWLVLFGVWAYRFFGILIFGSNLEDGKK